MYVGKSVEQSHSMAYDVFTLSHCDNCERAKSHCIYF